MTKKIAFWVAVLSAGLAITPVQAAAIINFDEFGNGNYSLNGGPVTPFTGTLVTGPGCGSVGTCLTFMLGGLGLVGNGDVAVSDSAAAFVLGDGIRFTDANGNLTGNTADRMIYFSDTEQVSDGALADTGFPTNFSTTNSVIETGSEGSSSFSRPSTNTYNGISDGTLAPEPGTMLLLGSGAVALALALRRRCTR